MLKHIATKIKGEKIDKEWIKEDRLGNICG